MRQILRRDGELRDGCADTDADDADDTDACDAQEARFGLIFTVGAWANQGGRLLVGTPDPRAVSADLAACSPALSRARVTPSSF